MLEQRLHSIYRFNLNAARGENFSCVLLWFYVKGWGVALIFNNPSCERVPVSVTEETLSPGTAPANSIVPTTAGPIEWIFHTVLLRLLVSKKSLLFPVESRLRNEIQRWLTKVGPHIFI